MAEDASAAPDGPDAEGPRGPGSLARLLAARVRALRGRLDLTRAQLSARSGVSVAYLARLEAGTANISLQVLEQLAVALDTGAHALIDASAEPGSDLHALILALRAQPAAVHAELLRSLDERSADDRARRAPPARIALIGLRGAGKSTLGRALADRLGVPFVELNREIEREGGIAVSEVFTLYGAVGYRRLERGCLRQVVDRHPEVVLATGGGLVTDPDTYRSLRASFRTVWLRARPEDHFERVRRQQDARIAAPALETEAMANIRAMLAAREPLYARADLSLDTSGRTVADCVAALQALVAPASRDRDDGHGAADGHGVVPAVRETLQAVVSGRVR